MTVQTTGMLNVVLDGTKFFLPLGWHLSQHSINSIMTDKFAEAAGEVIAVELDGDTEAAFPVSENAPGEWGGIKTPLRKIKP